MRVRLVWLVAAALAMSACDGVDTRSTGPKATVTERSTTHTPVSPVAPLAADVLTSSGVADIRAGMTIAEVEALGHAVTLAQPSEPGSTCGFARIEGMEGLLAMLDGERLVRFDVNLDETEDKTDARQWQTLEGAGVGTTEAELSRLYGERLSIDPGGLAIVHAKGDPFGIVFETDGSKVLRWRVGQWEHVQLEEGCS